MILLISEFAIARVCIKKSLRSNFEKPNTRPVPSSSFTAFGRKLALANFFPRKSGSSLPSLHSAMFPRQPRLVVFLQSSVQYGGKSRDLRIFLKSSPEKVSLRGSIHFIRRFVTQITQFQIVVNDEQKCAYFQFFSRSKSKENFCRVLQNARAYFKLNQFPLNTPIFLKQRMLNKVSANRELIRRFLGNFVFYLMVFRFQKCSNSAFLLESQLRAGTRAYFNQFKSIYLKQPKLRRSQSIFQLIGRFSVTFLLYINVFTLQNLFVLAKKGKLFIYYLLFLSFAV